MPHVLDGSRASTKAPDISTARPSASRAPTASRASDSSFRPTSRPSVVPSMYKSTTLNFSSPSQVSKTRASKPLTPSDYLKRGPPRNVAGSAFYDNPDGAEARANRVACTLASPDATIPSPPLHLGPASQRPSSSMSRPSERPPASAIPPPPRAPSGGSVYPAHLLPTSEMPRVTVTPPSNAPSASKAAH